MLIEIEQQNKILQIIWIEFSAPGRLAP